MFGCPRSVPTNQGEFKSCFRLFSEILSSLEIAKGRKHNSGARQKTNKYLKKITQIIQI